MVDHLRFPLATTVYAFLFLLMVSDSIDTSGILEFESFLKIFSTFDDHIFMTLTNILQYQSVDTLALSIFYQFLNCLFPVKFYFIWEDSKCLWLDIEKERIYYFKLTHHFSYEIARFYKITFSFSRKFVILENSLIPLPSEN